MNITYVNQQGDQDQDIYNSSTRFIPTYYHTQIFTPQPTKQQKVRYTPTFQSQILPSYPKAKKNFMHINKASLRTSSPGNIVYKNVSRQRKHKQFYNSRGNCTYKSEQLWYDIGKRELFDKMKQNKEYPRDRRQLDLSSGDVFEGGKITLDQIQSAIQEQQIIVNTPCQAYAQTDHPSNHKQPKINILTQKKEKTNARQQQKRISNRQPKESGPQEKQKEKVVKIVKKKSKCNEIIEGYPRFTIIRNRPF